MSDDIDSIDNLEPGTRAAVRVQGWPSSTLEVVVEARMRMGREQAYPVPLELEDLLRAVRDHGSIVKGFEQVRMSYQSALALVRRWEAITGHELLVQQRGQGTVLTPFGRRLVEAREWLDRRLQDDFTAVARDLAAFLDMPVAPAPQRVVLHASHDLALERLQAFAAPRLAIELTSAGSLASLAALKDGRCEMAGFHLPEPASLLGPDLDAFAAVLNPREHAVMRLFGRRQGLLLRNDVRHRIRGLRDVVRHGLRLVNRELGSGTRLLLDALLRQEMLEPGEVAGYEHEVTSHTDLARAIRGGDADVAFGIEAAARAQGLRFVPVVTESYYVACRRADESSVALDTLAACVRSDTFVASVRRIGGYDLAGSGTQVKVSDLLAPAPAHAAPAGWPRR
ncbi:MAG: substrate-binding domain-containing protein [Burkholderiales bacterium]